MSTFAIGVSSDLLGADELQRQLDSEMASTSDVEIHADSVADRTGAAQLDVVVALVAAGGASIVALIHGMFAIHVKKLEARRTGQVMKCLLRIGDESQYLEVSGEMERDEILELLTDIKSLEDIEHIHFLTGGEE